MNIVIDMNIFLHVFPRNHSKAAKEVEKLKAN